MEMSVYWPGVCCVSLYVCLCVFVCVISNQSSSEKLHVSDLSKIDSLLNQTHQGRSDTEVPRLDMCRFIISLSKIAHQL